MSRLGGRRERKRKRGLMPRCLHRFGEIQCIVPIVISSSFNRALLSRSVPRGDRHLAQIILCKSRAGSTTPPHRTPRWRWRTTLIWRTRPRRSIPTSARPYTRPLTRSTSPFERQRCSTCWKCIKWINCGCIESRWIW
jgi:hypothetical protein